MEGSVSLNIKSFCRLIATCLFYLFIVSNLSAQEVWTTDQFINGKLNDEELPYQENINFLDRAKGMPLVDNYDFRTETDEMIFDQQRYQLRFKFNSSDERKAYDKILIANKNKYALLQAQYELEVWEEKYKNVLDLYFCQKEMQLVSEELELLADKQKVLEKLLTNDTNVDVSGWISNQADIFNVLSDSLKLELQKKEIVQKLVEVQGRDLKLDETDFITISQIRENVSKIVSNADLHPDESLALAEEELANAEYNLEQAEARKWLEFAQIQYQSENRLSFQREISLGTSITIPSKNNNIVKRNDATLELLEKSYETKLEQEENKRAIITEEAKILSLFKQLEDYIAMRKRQRLDAIFESYAEQKIVSPLILIEIKRSILANDKKQLDIEKDIYESYVNILTKKAAFLKVPRINFLKE